MVSFSQPVAAPGAGEEATGASGAGVPTDWTLADW